MADRDVTIDIEARDKTGPGIQSAKRRFDDLGQHVKRTASRNDVGPEFARMGTQAGVAFGKTLTRSLGAIGLPAGAALVGGIAGQLPLLGGLAAGAIIGGVGAGGIVGGVVAAADDARVQSAGARLATRLGTSFQDKAAVFVQPILEGFDQIDRRIFQLGPRIDRLFDVSAGSLPGLVDAALDFVDYISKGMDRLVASGGVGAVLREIEFGIRLAGQAIDLVMHGLADNGQDAALAVRYAMELLAGTIIATGKAVEGLAASFGFIAAAGGFGMDIQRSYWAAKIAADGASAANAGYADSFRRLTTDADQYADSQQKIINQNMAMAGSQLGVKESTLRLREMLKENGRTLNENTAAGQQNMRGLMQLATNMNAYRAAIEKKNGVGQLSAQVEATQRIKFLETARQMGANERQAIELADSYLGIPTSTETVAEFDKQRAEANRNNYNYGLSTIPRSVTTVLNLDVSRALAAARSAAVSIRRAAQANPAGGMAAAGWASSAPGQTSRTAPPTRVDVTSKLYLDSTLIYQGTASQARAEIDRERWRNRGRR